MGVGARDRLRTRRRDPADVAVVASALPAGVYHEVVAASIAAGVPVASSEDEHDALEQLRALDPERAVGGRDGRGRAAASRPGWPTSRASAARVFESVDEIRVARTGWAGPASVDTVRHERRVPARAWRDGSWREERSAAMSSCSFPIRSADATATRHRADAAAGRCVPERVANRRCSSASRRGARASPPLRRRRRVGRGAGRGLGPARRVARLSHLRRRRPHVGCGRNRARGRHRPPGRHVGSRRQAAGRSGSRRAAGAGSRFSPSSRSEGCGPPSSKGVPVA